MYNSKSFDRVADKKPSKSERKQIKQERNKRKSKFNRYDLV